MSLPRIEAFLETAESALLAAGEAAEFLDVQADIDEAQRLARKALDAIEDAIARKRDTIIRSTADASRLHAESAYTRAVTDHHKCGVNHGNGPQVATSEELSG